MNYPDEQYPTRAYSAVPAASKHHPPASDAADSLAYEEPGYPPDNDLPSAQTRGPADWGVQPGMYLGGTVATAVTVGLLAWIVAIIGNRLYSLPTEQYWTRNGYATTPTMGVGLWIGAAVAATAIAAGVVWMLTAHTPSAGTFITVIGLASSVLGAVLIGMHAGTGTQLWQTGIGNAATVLILGITVTIGLHATARKSTTHPERF